MNIADDLAKAFNDGYARGKAEAEHKRGYWYDKGSLSCRCSNCGCKSPEEFNFCPNCGAKMSCPQSDDN